MRIVYYPAVDMLRIELRDAPFQAEGHPVDELDTVLYSDENNRLAEVEVSHASERVDLEALRQHEAFEEGREKAQV